MGPEGTTSGVLFLSFVILLTFIGLFFVFWAGWWISHRYQGVSPYTGQPLRRATDLSYFAAEKVLHYLYDFKQYDNRVFKLSRAAYCRETGRIFQDCVSWLDTVNVDWNFIQKRYPGDYVSWGSLTEDQQRDIREVHETLEFFQIRQSSKNSSPRMVEPEYVFLKPGPLYVNVHNKVLVGWQVVPDTELEVLVVQKPIR
jgi:hypothetical protein